MRILQNISSDNCRDDKSTKSCSVLIVKHWVPLCYSVFGDGHITDEQHRVSQDFNGFDEYRTEIL